MDLHWRNTQKQARFFALDARAFAAVFLFLIHARLWTFVLAIVVMIVFWILERRGLTFDAALRALRSWILGRNRPATLKTKRRSWIDFG
jgi:intracellular multiplication protein IcmT